MRFRLFDVMQVSNYRFVVDENCGVHANFRADNDINIDNDLCLMERYLWE